MKKLWLAAVVSTLMSVAPSMMMAQSITTGEVSGRVIDPSGANVGGAQVTLLSNDQGTSSTVTADGSGNFRFSLLRPGIYTLTETGSNMSAKTDNVSVGVGQTTTVNLSARPGATVTTVEVSAAEPLLQVESANITTTFGLQQMQDLPLAGADLSSVPLTAPGVIMATGGGLSSNFFVFGMPGTSNLFTINGADLMDPFYNINNSGSSNNTIGANEIANVSVVVNGYSGQYGRLPGANVNYTTKGGGNQWHGSGKYMYNGSFLNSRDWFAAHNGDERPKTISNEYGVDVSGWIIKNKLFFYFDDEGLRYVSAGGSTQVFVPTPAFAQAVQANVAANQPAESAYYSTIFKLYGAANGSSTAVADTAALTGDATQGCADLVIAGFGANGQPCANVYNSTNNSLNTEQFYAARIDQNIGDKDKIFYRYKHDFGIQATSTDPINNAFSANSVQPEWEGQLNETHIFTPNIVNNFTAAGSYYKAIFGPASIGAALAVFPTTLQSAVFTTLGGADNQYPSGRNVAQYQFVDDVSYTKGKNSYKAGVNFRRNLFSNFANQPGSSGLTNLLSLTDFYNGVISNGGGASATGSGQIGGSSIQYSFPTQGPIAARFYSLGFYVEDQIKVSDKLQLTATIRFDRNSNPACRHACFTRLNGPFSSIAKGASVPYNQSIITGQFNPYPSVQSVSVQPRFGFAFTPGGSVGKTVIRGGVGMFADSPILALTSRFLTAAPSDPSFTLQNATNSSNPNGVYPIFAGASGSAYSALSASNKAFQTGFANGSNLTQLQGAVAATGNTFNPPAYSASVNDELKNPKYLEYNLDIQRQVTNTDVVDIDYVGNYAYDIFFQNSQGNAYAKKGDGFGGLPSTQPDPRFTAVTNLTNLAHSNYNGVSFGYRHQAKFGLTTSVSYTFGKVLGTTSNGGLYGSSAGVEGDPLVQIDAFSPSRLNYGPLDYDVRHSMNLNYVWDIHAPVNNYLAKQVLGGWTLAGVAFYKSGAPFSVYNTAAKTAEVGTSSTAVVLAALLPGQTEASCRNPNTVCLTKSQFATTAGQVAYGFGNTALNYYRGPSFVNTDTSLTKAFTLHERYKLKIGAIANNVLNHPNFAPPTNSLTSGTFGKIQQTVVSSPSSLYGNGQGSAPSGRVLALTAGFTF